MITSNDLPTPGGHYSHGVAHNDLVFISGQLPVKADGHRAVMSFEEQVRQAMANLLAVLRVAGGTPADILKLTAYIVGIDHWPEFNRIYAEIIGDAKPARAVVPVPALHHGYLIEIEAIARRALS
jgi:2-iminobutanoate/2-iminopropanoate deaminase